LKIFSNDPSARGAIKCQIIVAAQRFLLNLAEELIRLLLSLPYFFRLEGPPAARDSPSPMASRGNRENLRPLPAFVSDHAPQARPEPTLRVIRKDARRPARGSLRSAKVR
jgi:hypothetical protein